MFAESPHQLACIRIDSLIVAHGLFLGSIEDHFVFEGLLAVVTVNFYCKAGNRFYIREDQC
jgi:hypothetical protein